MTDDELYAHPGWQWCTFDGARRDILRRGVETTFREKLEWLEEAESLALRFRRARAVDGAGSNETSRLNG